MTVASKLYLRGESHFKKTYSPKIGTQQTVLETDLFFFSFPYVISSLVCFTNISLPTFAQGIEIFIRYRKAFLCSKIHGMFSVFS